MLDMAKEKPRKTSQYSDEAQDAAMRANPYRGGTCCPMFGKLFPWCVILFFIVFPVWAAHHGISTDNLLVPVCAAITVLSEHYCHTAPPLRINRREHRTVF